VGLFASLAGIAEARARGAARRAGRRAGLAALAGLLALVAIGFGTGAATVALANRYGAVTALLVMAAIAVVGVLIVVAVLAADARRARREAARRPGLERTMARAAIYSAATAGRKARLPSRGLVGLAFVAIGALLVLRGRDDD
jgi:hypothetical protein